MILREASSSLRHLAFRVSRVVASVIPGGRISAFGQGENRIGSILIINLDRQPGRWRRVLRELRRFLTSDGAPLASIARRLAAVDARDGRAVAATADVDATYRMGDQLFVQPDPRLDECFGLDEPIRMTRQEVAVARSHIEAWKAVASGSVQHVLVLEDDVWFTYGAAAAIGHGWTAALRRCGTERGPRLLYFSYTDADAERVDICDALFRPLRGLWCLSGYVLSREGAAALLRAMPVVGPVDLWMNKRFEELGALALTSPVILQRVDGASDNSYSILPYLARAGIVDSGSAPVAPSRVGGGPLIAWSSNGDREGLAMALSMLGLRVRVFDGDELELGVNDLLSLFEVFDVVLDAPLASDALNHAFEMDGTKFVLEGNPTISARLEPNRVPPSRVAIVSKAERDLPSWKPLCDLLGLEVPVEPYPTGAPKSLRLFRDDRSAGVARSAARRSPGGWSLDDSPWILPPSTGWQPARLGGRPARPNGELVVSAAMNAPAPALTPLVETFPGNLASFGRDGLAYDADGTHLTLTREVTGTRPYRSGAFASTRAFDHVRVEAEIRAASGSGLVTGFFLHRDSPRQEIDVELFGNAPGQMLVNVYFNPGDEGAALGFGYRGTPYVVDLGFDATSDFHRYSIDWRPGRITWSVDGRIVHERVGWDPTPIPHLPMRLYGNLWAPRSKALAGQVDDESLPTTATFRNVTIWV